MTFMISQTGYITPPYFVPHRELLNLLSFYSKNTWQLNSIINLLSILKNVFNKITLNLHLFTNPNIQQMNLILYCWSRSSFMLHWILLMSKIDSQSTIFCQNCCYLSEKCGVIYSTKTTGSEWLNIASVHTCLLICKLSWLPARAKPNLWQN